MDRNTTNTLNSDRNKSLPLINTSLSKISKINSQKTLNNSNLNKSSMNNISYQLANQNSKEIKNRSVINRNSQSKILEENFLANLSQINSNEDENIDSQENSESISEKSDSPIDFDMKNLNKSLREILENISENEIDYTEGLEKYYEHLQGKLKIFENSEMEKIKQRQIIDLQSETLDEQINHLHSMIEQYKAENKKLKFLVKSEKAKNPHLQYQIDENSLIIERIYSAIKYFDVTKLMKFQKNLINRRGTDMDLEEATNSVRGNGGDYLKRQAALMYFIHLLKLRYKLTKIPQDNRKVAKKENDTYVPNINEINSGGKLSDNKIRVILGGESYLVGLEEDKTETYSILDLKNEVCDVWNIPKEDREYYHIINDKFHVYSQKILVWEIQLKFVKSFLEGSNKTSNPNASLITLELINKNQIVYGRNAADISPSENAANKADKNKKDKNVSNSNDLERVKKDIDISSLNSNFISTLEEYVLFLRQKEAFFNLFKRDKMKADMIKKHQDKVKIIQQKHDVRKKELENLEAEDEEFQEIENRLQVELKEIREKIKYKLINHKNKQDPLYFSTYDIFLFRLVKFWHLVFYIFIVAIMMVYFTNDSTVTTIEKYTLKDVINNVIVFNPLYKNFMRNDNAFLNENFGQIISTRRNLLIWLEILFNNLMMMSKISAQETADGVDSYNLYFQRPNTIYDILGAIKFSFKNSYPVSSKANDTIFILPTYISNALHYFEEFKVTQEDTTYKSIDSATAEAFQATLGQYENQCCDYCVTNRNLSYDSYPNRKMLLVKGKYGDYSDGHFKYYLNPTLITREEFYSLMEFIKEVSIMDPECRMLKIDININHIYLKAIIKVSLIFEFSTIGGIQATYLSDVYDTNEGSSFSNFIRMIYYAIFVIIGLKIFLNYFTFFLMGDKAKKINYISIYCEIAIMALLVIEISFSIQKTLSYDSIFGTLFDLNNTTYSTKNRKFNAWHYYEIDPLLNITIIQKAIQGGIIMVLFLRIILCFMSSPIIKYIMVLIIRTTIGIFNITVILLIFIFSFSLIFHVVLGKNVLIYSSLANTFLITLTSVLGRLQIHNTKTMTTVHYLIVVSFFIVIKFIIFPFVFAIIKETFENVRKEYDDYVGKPHFKYLGDNIYLFLKYLMFPFSFYFMSRDYMRFKKMYRNFPRLEKFVKEDNHRKSYL